MYQTLFTFLKRFFSSAFLFRVGFNWSPMYRRSTGRLKYVSPDLLTVKVEVPLSWKNSNYVGSIFGGSMLSASDPILMIQLIQILGEDFVVWDKAVTMRFKRPARERIFIEFTFTQEEIDHIRQTALEQGELDIDKVVQLKSKDGAVFAEVTKTMYIATKAHYRQKQKARAEKEIS